MNKLKIKEVRRTPKNRRIFRTMARDNSGESLEPGEDEKIFFGYGEGGIESDIRSVASIRLANVTSPEDSKSYFHWLTFLFVKKDFQCMGHGSQMLDFVQNYAWDFLSHPVRTNAARKAIGFFKKNCYEEVGQLSECLCPGGGIFHFLQLMERSPSPDMVEMWD